MAERTYCPCCNRPLDQPTETRKCPECGNDFEGKGRAIYCSQACKMRAWRKRDQELVKAS